MKARLFPVFSRVLLLGLLLLSLPGRAQQTDANKIQLANSFYQNKEFAKAALLYNQLYESTKSSYYFELYLTCLTEAGDLDAAEKEIRKAIRRTPAEASLYVYWADVLKRQENPAEAEAKLKQALEVAPVSRPDYTRLANAYLTKGEYRWAEKLYLQAIEKMPAENFLFELGRVYLIQRDYTKMFDTYLDMIRADEKNMPRMQSSLSSAFRLDVDNSLREQLRTRLLNRMQKEPGVLAYNRLLIWLFMQEQNYTQALRQQIALDKRSGQESAMIAELARIAGQNGEYAEGLKACDYLLAQGESSPYYFQSRLLRLQLQYQQFNAQAPGALPATELAARFEALQTEMGLMPELNELTLNYTHLLAFDLHQPEQAIALLKKAVEMPRRKPIETDELKTALADVYILAGDVWESVLLYSQVIEANKANELGDEVKLKKARLGYYMGELSWAKAQLDVLKASTSKLIANDAMELAVFIGNNMNLDTTSRPLQLFARADLELFRNQPERALATLDSLQTAFPGHSLQTYIYDRKAAIRIKQGRWHEAANLLEQITTEYPWDLLADDALMKLGNLYQTPLSDPEKAKTIYRQLMEKYPGSVHVSEARELFRHLRGDFSPGDSSPVQPNESRF